MNLPLCAFAALAVTTVKAETGHVHSADCVHANDWTATAELVVSGSLGATSAGDAYEDLLASAHTDPMHEGPAFGGAELLAAFGRPFYQGYLNIRTVFHVHRHPGESSETELDELCAEWSQGLFRLQAGIFYAPLGGTNPIHAHAWDFVNAPLFYGRFLGESGLRNPGIQLAWGDSNKGTSWTIAVQRATGDSAHSFRSSHDDADFLGRVHNANNGNGPIVTLRHQRAYQWAEGRSLTSGLSATFGDNGTGGSTRLAAWDLEWTQKREGGGYYGVQAEFFWRHYDANAGTTVTALPVAADRMQDVAVAVSVASSLSENWSAALRVERAVPLDRASYELSNRDPAREARTRFSPILSWNPSSAWQIRLQYDRDQSPVFGSEDSLWLTAQWSIGQH